MRRWLVVLAVVLGVPVVCVAWFFVEANHRITHKREVAAREVPRMLALLDGKVGGLFESPLFARPDGDDAGPLLNDRLDVTGHASENPLLPEHCTQTLREYAGRDAEISVEKLVDCDTSVLTELRRFGRWSLAAGRRATLPPGPRADDALPELLVLQRLSKIHLVKAHASGHFAEAVEDVRHLARLLFTQEYLLTSMFGIALLHITHNLAAKLGEDLEFPETKEELDALRRRLFVSYYSVIPLSPLAHAQNTPSAPRFVRCVTLTEQAFGRELSALPPDADCWFENARFELTHPWKGPELDSVAALSAPARIGGHIAFALIDLTSLRDQLLAADELPADDAWEGAVSEYLTRTMSP